MRKQTFILMLSLFVSVATFSQEKLISVKGTNTDAITKTLKEAIELAEPGDKIYLPGGNNFELDTLKKKVHIIGTGYNPNIERATYVTNIKTPVRIEAGASGSTFTGIRFLKNINLIKANNITFNKVYAFVDIDGKDNVSNTYSENITFIHSYLNKLIYFNTIKVLNSVVKQIYHTNSFEAKNSIIATPDTTDSMFRNCLTVTKVTNSGLYNTVAYNCEAYTSTTFVGGNTQNLFKFDYDLHIHSDSPLFGKNLGVYNGENPWKEGGQPRNPHILYNRSTLDVQNNKFNIRVKVLPQKN